ncbi:isovaleryl-CoA dehydrogenase, mitochondrial [Tetranychus urticae]|uniref:Isobutyryl-CoA dehydrogenase, mitochondrial n=1 Tax=Tetranychus urticae TaxID=32264 RepID=T1K2G0_TETUR|nr:isovaleryl-CoA dehydrogenase, mitochondrial [Tetranychus urticae]
MLSRFSTGLQCLGRRLTSISSQRFSTDSISDHSSAINGLTPDQAELRSSVRKFLDKELPLDLVGKIDKDGHYPGFRDFFKKLGSMGLLGPTVSREYGGLDLTYLDHCIIMEEISRSSAALGLSYGAHTNLCINQIFVNGNEEQKAKYLPGLIDGSKIGSLAMSETGAGSDVVSMKTKAEKKGDYYVINGSKFWITNGAEADVVFLYARTSDKGITAFIIEKGMEGFSLGQQIDKLGMRGSPTTELLFQDLKVPEKNIVGGLNNGVYVLMSGLDKERLVLAAGPVGIMQMACELAFDYTHQRNQFGKPIGTFQILQAKMADMYVALSVSRAYVYNVARAITNYYARKDIDIKGPSPYTKDCAGVILYTGEAGTKVALDAVQLLGGNGYANEYHVGRLVRDAKLYEIGAGTSEIRRWLIGRELNKAYLGK